MWAYKRVSILFALVLVLSMVLVPVSASADSRADYDIANGHFYTQAAGPGAPAGTGYAITDEDRDSFGHTIRFWSEFRRLGGVNALGYPASRRFLWNGFVSQATQRVVMQWRPEANTVYFVNVMDLITEAGKDDYLYAARQTPKPYNFKPEEQGMSLGQIVTKRYKLLDASPAIKAAFFSVPDPLQLNGLPTTPVTDMGDAYVLRAQRKIFQQWKKDVPWAKKGQVTVALGGDLAKETGLIAAQDKQAVIPMPPVTATTPPNRLPTDPHYYAVINLALSDINGFWKGEFTTLFPGKQYVSPKSFYYYYPGQVPPVDKSCLPSDPKYLAGNAFYCPPDMSISWDEAFMWQEYKTTGDIAPVAIIAHEWGHHIQHLSVVPNYSIQRELQADCYAGLYIKYAEKAGELNSGDVERAMYAFYTVGDEKYDDSSWFLPNVHGEPDQRALAFLTGYKLNDGQECIKYGSYNPGEIITFGPYLLALAPGTSATTLNDGTIRLDGVDGLADIRYRPDLPARSAAALLPSLADDWFGESLTRDSDIYPVDVPQLSGTNAYMEYEQMTTDENNDPLLVHGIYFVHVGPQGGGFIFDVYEPGAAPKSTAAWDRLGNQLVKMIYGLSANR